MFPDKVEKSFLHPYSYDQAPHIDAWHTELPSMGIDRHDDCVGPHMVQSMSATVEKCSVFRLKSH